MNVIICGAGQVGTHTAQVLSGSGHDITVIDIEADRLRSIEETMDVRTLQGNCANADVLRDAGASNSTASLVAATSHDEINLLTASVAKGVGAGNVVARVHHSAYFDHRGLDYQKYLHIDHLICPEYSTAQAIASSLRNPLTMAAEKFGSGQIEMQEFTVTFGVPALGKKLVELDLPLGVRLVAVERGCESFLPTATTEIFPGDVVVLVGNSDAFQQGRKQFQKEEGGRRRVVIMGGPAMAVWLSRALHDKSVAVRLFETNRARAEELADKLEWVTVVNADPTDPAVFEEERIGEADSFVALRTDDEHNILSCAWAKTAGVKQTIAVITRPTYARLIERVGVDEAFNPSAVAARQIALELDMSGLVPVASLGEGAIQIFRVRVGARSELLGKPLRKLKLSPRWMIAAIEHGQKIRVPTAEDFIHVGDTVILAGKPGDEKRLRELFDA